MVLQSYSVTGSSPPADTRKATLIKAPAKNETTGTQDPEVLTLALSDVTVQLARALRSKEEILRNVSHEFRSPLTLIIGYAETLNDLYWGELTEEQVKATSVILEQSRRLQSLVERMLRLQTVDSGALNRIPVPVEALIGQVVDKWQSLIAQAGGRLLVECAPALPQLSCDPAMLGQAFDDLLDNAVKFGLRAVSQSDAAVASSNGQTGRSLGVIRLRAWTRDGYVHISVTDYGIGIAKDEIEQIFDRFYQVERGLTRSRDGVGIGLALVQSIVRAHEGTVRVRSQGSNLGSTFTVSLPVATGYAAGIDGPLSSTHHPPA